eukprot:851198-Rhodomonas_salina.2
MPGTDYAYAGPTVTTTTADTTTAATTTSMTTTNTTTTTTIAISVQQRQGRTSCELSGEEARGGGCVPIRVPFHPVPPRSADLPAYALPTPYFYSLGSAMCLHAR